MNVHHPPAAGLEPVRPIRTEGQPLDGQDRRGVEHAIGLYAGLEARRLDLQSNDLSERTHNAM
jgi:hypothetical protein